MKRRAAILGATGLVGRTMLALLEERGFPLDSLRLLASERLTDRRLQFRGEATNAFNIVNLSNPTTGQNSSTFGQIRTARPMRQIQLGLRLTF